VRQRAERLAPGGRIVGITIEDLIVSPFHQTALQVDQGVGVVEGELTGIRIERAITSDRLLELDTLLHLALLDPAAALSAEMPSVQVVVFIDGLDELRYRPASGSVVDWLAECPPLPENVRFVITSREDDALLGGFRARQREWLREERIDGASAHVRPDALRYSALYSVDPAISGALRRHGTNATAFAARLADKAAGNFQYISSLCRGIEAAVEFGDEEGAAQLVRLDGLPNDLESLYGYFIDLVTASVGQGSVELDPLDLSAGPRIIPAWEGLYQPILEILGAALAPLSAEQLIRFTDTGESRYDYRGPVRAAVRRLAQFLRRDNDEIALYHSTFQDYVSSDAGSARGLNVRAAHRRVARFYRSGQRDWDAVEWAAADDYGLLHLAGHLVHLAAAGAVPFTEVEGLLRRPFMAEKLRRLGSHAAFAADIRYALDAGASCREDGEPVAGIASELRLRWLAAKLSSLARAVPPDLIAAIARSGAATRALGLAELITSAGERLSAYVAIGAESVKVGEPEAGRIALGVACGLLREHALSDAYPLDLVLQAYARLGDPDGVTRAADLIGQLDGAEAREAAVVGVVDAYASLGDAARCCAWAQRISPTSADRAARAARALAAVGAFSDAISLADRSATAPARARGLATVAVAMAARGHSQEEAAALADQALGIEPMAAYRDAFAALVRTGQRPLAVTAAERIPPGTAQARALLALEAMSEHDGEASAQIQRAMAMLTGALQAEQWPADAILDVIPDLTRLGDAALLRAAFSIAARLPDDGYGSSVTLIAAFAEAFAVVGDRSGIDSAFDAMTGIWDNTGRQSALTGLARACVDARYRVDDVRAAGRGLHRHFTEPWAVDVEVAMCLAESGQAASALDLAESLLDEIQRPDDVAELVRWRRAVADGLIDCGRNQPAVDLCQSALRLGELLAVSSDEENARNRLPYWDELYGPHLTVAVAEGMEWSRVVHACAPVLVTLGRSRDAEATQAALRRLASLAEISFPPAEAAASVFGEAAIAVLEMGRPAEAVAMLEQLQRHYPVLAADRWPELVQSLVTAGARDEAIRGTRLALEAADFLGRSRTYGRAALACDAAGLTADADRVLALVDDAQDRSEALEELAWQACDRGDSLRSRRIIEEFLTTPLDGQAREPDLLAGAARTLARLGEEPQAVSVADATLTLIGADFGRADLLPPILGRLAEAAVYLGDNRLFTRVLDQAEAAGDGPWGRRAIHEVARTATTEQARQWLNDRQSSAELPAHVRTEISFAKAQTEADSLIAHSQDLRPAMRNWRATLALDDNADVSRLAWRLTQGARMIALSGTGADLEETSRGLTEIDSWWPSGAWLGGRRFF
jgi:tetratricopeptide (TPR) repeat protein